MISQLKRHGKGGSALPTPVVGATIGSTRSHFRSWARSAESGMLTLMLAPPNPFAGMS